MKRRRARWWSSPPVKYPGSSPRPGCSFHRPQNRPEPANTGWRGRATVRPDRLSPKLRVNGGRGAPRAMRAPDGDPTAAAAVSSSPGDTVSAPCRGSRPGPAALDRLPQSRGPAPARPGRYGRPDESSTGGQRREVAMGKGLPGGRRQAGSIDYRPNPSSSETENNHTALRHTVNGTPPSHRSCSGE